MGEPKVALEAEAHEVHDAHGDHGEHAEAHESHEEAPEAHDAHGHAHSGNPYKPLAWNELAALVIVVIAAILIGIAPRPFFRNMDASSAEYAGQVQRYLPAQTQSTAQK
ncbi:MAG: hypothetical protein U0528_18345 [Anaerolineae bacterium]